MPSRDTVRLYPVHFPKVRVGENLARVLVASLKDEGIILERGDIVAIASKVVSTCEGRIVRLSTVSVSRATKHLARTWKMDEALAAVVVKEADEVLGGVNGFLLTVKDGVLTANAGVDLKNSPRGTATLWPTKPDLSAGALRKAVERIFDTKVGIVIVDSRLTPLRLGTTGVALGVSGFHPIADHRKKKDLYRRKVRVTQSNLADDVAAMAHMLMGETREKIGAVVVRNAPTHLRVGSSTLPLKLDSRSCLIMNATNRRL